VVAIADEFVQDAGYQCQCFGVVESDTAGEAALGELACGGDEEFVDLGVAIVSKECFGGEFGYLLGKNLPPWVLIAFWLVVDISVKLHRNH
jgi:hypothetical protein